MSLRIEPSIKGTNRMISPTSVYCNSKSRTHLIYLIIGKRDPNKLGIYFIIFERDYIIDLRWMGSPFDKRKVVRLNSPRSYSNVYFLIYY